MSLRDELIEAQLQREYSHDPEVDAALALDAFCDALEEAKADQIWEYENGWVVRSLIAVLRGDA